MAMADTAFDSFLLAEYEHAAASFLANEEDGERRAQWFVAVAGAVLGAAGWLIGDRGETFDPGKVPLVMLFALAISLAFGVTTSRRLFMRNRASDKLKVGLTRIRRHFVPDAMDSRRRSLAFDPWCEMKWHAYSPWRIGNGGWFPTIMMIDALVAGAFLALVLARVFSMESWWGAAGIGVAGALCTWFSTMRLAKVAAAADAKERTEEWQS